MPNKPPYYQQEEDYSCGPACLRMVLDALGTFKTEDELRHLSKCNEDGTFPEDLVDAARQSGHNARLEKDSNFDRLRAALDAELYPIVFLRVRASPNIAVHAVVVVAISENEVQVFDPDPKWEKHNYSKEQFWREWYDERRRMIVVG